MANQTDTDDRYIVMCRVSGGMTGTREAALRSSLGHVQYFTAAGAAAEAARLNAIPRPHARARFHYWAVPS